jgi:cytochrome c peroxidase
MRFTTAVAAVLSLLGLAACSSSGSSAVEIKPNPARVALTAQVRHWATDINGLTSLDAHPGEDPARVELGRMLFFDKELSGDRDTSCATCHQVTLASTDGIALSIGTGGHGIGEARVMGSGRKRHPRNSQDLFNRGASEWTSAFWDKRIFIDEEDGTLHSPAGAAAPAHERLIDLQTMFPFTMRDEMRGDKGDLDVYGNHNELADFDDEDYHGIWNALMKRVMAIPGYRTLFAAAFPGTPLEDMDFSYASRALGSFIIHDFASTGDPWDRFLAGEDDAMSDSAKRGAMVYMGEGRCIECHGGNLLTDQEHYNLILPELGPGPDFDPDDNTDKGVERITGKSDDRWTFRVPPLRNIELTGPYMHNGCFQSLEDAIRHHLDPYKYAMAYDPYSLEADLQASYNLSQAMIEQKMKTIPDELETPTYLTDEQFDDLMAFMYALTDPAARDMSRIRPSVVPSGIPLTDE